MLLDVQQVVVRFGGVTALDQVDLAVAQGSITGLIGPNGAGKTTLFNCVSRLYEPSEGSIRFDGAELLELAAHDIVDRGIARTYQHVSLFPDLTVVENVMLGAHNRSESGVIRSLVPFGRAQREQALIDEGYELLARLDLDHLALEPAHGMPYGTLKRIEIARALASRPRLLMLDEPAGGLTHSEVDDLAGLIVQLRDEFELSVLLVEHHMALVMGISDTVNVLNFGKNLATGTPAEVTSNPLVIEAYLGSQA